MKRHIRTIKRHPFRSGINCQPQVESVALRPIASVQRASPTATIAWHDAEEKPDTDTTVLVATDDSTHDEPVFLGYWCSEENEWRDIHGCHLFVTHWADIPEHPYASAKALAMYTRRLDFQIATIKKIVADEFTLSVGDLEGPRRTAKIAWARQLAMHLSEKFTQATQKDITLRFGGRDHSCVCLANTVIADRCATEPACRADLADLSAQIQTALQAASTLSTPSTTFTPITP